MVCWPIHLRWILIEKNHFNNPETQLACIFASNYCLEPIFMNFHSNSSPICSIFKEYKTNSTDQVEKIIQFGLKELYVLHYLIFGIVRTNGYYKFDFSFNDLPIVYNCGKFNYLTVIWYNTMNWFVDPFTSDEYWQRKTISKIW